MGREGLIIVPRVGSISSFSRPCTDSTASSLSIAMLELDDVNTSTLSSVTTFKIQNVSKFATYQQKQQPHKLWTIQD
jgi:hypothetical protein